MVTIPRYGKWLYTAMIKVQKVGNNREYSRDELERRLLMRII